MRAAEVEERLKRPRGRSLIFNPINALNPVFLEILVLPAVLGYSFCWRPIRA